MKTRYCAKCNIVYSAESEYCYFCGNRLSDVELGFFIANRVNNLRHARVVLRRLWGVLGGELGGDGEVLIHKYGSASIVKNPCCPIIVGTKYTVGLDRIKGVLDVVGGARVVARVLVDGVPRGADGEGLERLGFEVRCVDGQVTYVYTHYPAQASIRNNISVTGDNSSER